MTPFLHPITILNGLVFCARLFSRISGSFMQVANSGAMDIPQSLRVYEKPLHAYLRPAGNYNCCFIAHLESEQIQSSKPQ
jgi:hypothetical protein